MADVYQAFHIGVNIFVVRDGKLLFGKRKNIYGAGTWGLPGGHLEQGEAMTSAAARELDEETGLTARNFIFASLVNDNKKDDHYIQIGFIADQIVGEPTLREPDRCEAWSWFDLDALPKDIFPPHKRQVELFLEKRNFSDKS